MEKIQSQFSKVCGLLLVFLIGSTLVNAQAYIDYAETKSYSEVETNAPIRINPNQVNVLTARQASISANLNRPVRNHMFMFLTTTAPGSYSLEWEIVPPKAGNYEVSTLISTMYATIELLVGIKPLILQYIRSTH